MFHAPLKCSTTRFLKLRVKRNCQIQFSLWLTSFLAILILLHTGCTPKPTSRMTWKEKKQQILDSLSSCRTTVDSLICLNRFAHRDVSHGAPNLQCDLIADANQRFNWNAETWYHYILKDSITVFCAGNANFYRSLIHEFMNYTNVPHGYSIGVPGKSIGHYLILVLNVTTTQANMYLFDPMFNSTYRLRDGTMADLRHMIYLIRSGARDLFELQTFGDQSAYLLDSNEDTSRSNALYDLSFPYQLKESRNTSFPMKLRAQRTLDHYLQMHFATTYKEIASFYGGDTLSFSNSDEFKNCILYRKDIYGPFNQQIDEELRFYETAPLHQLDSIFQPFGMSVAEMRGRT